MATWKIKIVFNITIQKFTINIFGNKFNAHTHRKTYVLRNSLSTLLNPALLTNITSVLVCPLSRPKS